MAELRELVMERLLELAPSLGDCPDCYGRGVNNKVGRFPIAAAEKATPRRPARKARFGLCFKTEVCKRCHGSGWLRSPYGRPRQCRLCGRVFQPVLGARGRSLTDCLFCQPGWLRSSLAYRRTHRGRWTTYHVVGSRGLSPSRRAGHAGPEVQPSVTRAVRQPTTPVGAGWASPTGGPADAQLNSQVRAAQPASQGRRGRPTTRRARPALAEGPARPAVAQPNDPARSRPGWEEWQRRLAATGVCASEVSPADPASSSPSPADLVGYRSHH